MTTETTSASRAQLHGMWLGRGRVVARARRLRRCARRHRHGGADPAIGTAAGRAGARARLRSRRRRPGSCDPGAAGRRVVLSDVAPEMTAIAAARAAARGLANVSTCELDLEPLEQPDGTFDVVLCREGLMFAADPARARGRSGASCGPAAAPPSPVWAARERNPWLGAGPDRRQRAARPAGAAAGSARSVLARRSRPAGRDHDRGGPHGRRRRRGRRAAACGASTSG